MKVCGVDIGKKGGIAINDDGDVTVVPIPYLPDNTLNVFAVSDLFFDADFILMEKPFIPNGIANKGTQVAVSEFGELLGVAKLVAKEVETVSPVSWKKSLGLSRDKQLSIDMAEKLYPSQSLMRTARSKKPCDGMAEALLILHYALFHLP